jgi:hypothetical protein
MQVRMRKDPSSKLRRVIGVLVFLPFGMIGLWFELVAFVHCCQSPGWPTSNGIILASKVEKDFNIKGVPHYAPRIRYSYVVAGQKLESNHIGFGLCRGMLTWGFADGKVEKFPKGKFAEVSYNAGRPEITCLEPGTIGWEDGLMAIACMLAIFFATKELATWIPKRFLLKSKPSSELTFTFIL